MTLTPYLTPLRRLWLGALLLPLALLTGSCIEDGFTSSPSSQPAFSTDTLKLGALFTGDPSPTHRFVIYNRNSKGISLSAVKFADDAPKGFRLNVDGIPGREFRNVEVRPNDSVFLFVEATLPESGKHGPIDILTHIAVECNGLTSLLPVTATGRDAVRLSGNTRYSSSTSLSPLRPYLVRDSLVVGKGATLTIPAGTELYFHSEAQMIVRGTLRVEGTAEKPVTMTGDRLGFVAAAIPYELMSGQWGGITFTSTSEANSISHASIRNSSFGIIVNEARSRGDLPGLQLVNTQMRNTKELTLSCFHTNVVAAGCEFSEAALGLVSFTGGNIRLNHCTLSNNYLFTAIGGAALQFSHTSIDDADEAVELASHPYLTADISNSIIYGLGAELFPADIVNLPITFRNCLLKSKGTDDDNFLATLWGADPLFHTVRSEYLFDYRLKPDSPAASAADPALTLPLTAADRYGTPRLPSPSLGAYQFTPPPPTE